MAVEEGTYLIINANANKALDVNGGGDQSGANVQLWDVIRSDAQMWTLVQAGDAWRICCSLTGNWLDLENGNTANGTNIRQWSENGAPAQRWLISADGGTAGYGGKTYDTYTIATSCVTTGTQKVLDAAGGGTTPGTNVLLWEATGIPWQSWIFVPVDVFTEGGTYRIVSEMDTRLCVDITAASEASGARACTWTNNDQSNQVFEAEAAGNGLVRLVAAHSGKALDVDHGANADGRVVLQWPVEEGNANQLWLPVQAGTVKIDDVTVPTYELRNQSGSNRCMDVAGASKVAGTGIVVWTRKGASNQRFAFVKTEAFGVGIPAPTQLRPAYEEREGYGLVTVEGRTFYCGEGAYQARYTYNDHFNKSRLGWTGTHPWYNVADNSTARSGWGDAWAPTFTADGGEVELPLSFDFEITEENPYCELIVEVRAWRESHGVTGSRAHGPVTRTKVRIRRKPEVALDWLEFRAQKDGPDAPYVAVIWAGLSDNLGIGCTRVRARLVTRTGEVIGDWVTSHDLAMVQWEISRDVRRLPAEGEVVGVEYDMVNAEGGATKGTLWSESGVDFGSGSVVVSPEGAASDDGTRRWLVTACVHERDDCLLEVQDAGGVSLVECPLVADDGNDRTWAVCPPLNRDVRVFVLSQQGQAWGIGSLTLREDSDDYIWNWGDALDQCAVLRVDEGSPPSQSRSHKPRVNLSHTIGRRYPTAMSWGGESLDLSVEGSVVDSDGTRYASGSNVELLPTLAADGTYPVYRTPRSTWHKVAVTGLESGWKGAGYTSARIEQQAVTP